MRQPVSYLTQSQFYSPAFNAAIFDGPIRIYFAQYQEALALKVYFRMQERLKEFYRLAKEAYKQKGFNVFVMLYPTEETFAQSFSQAAPEKTVQTDRLGEDYVLGVRGLLQEEEYEQIYSEMEAIVRSWMSPESLEMDLETEAAPVSI